MFTGIIEEIGKIKKIYTGHLSIKTDFKEIKIGQSISVNGVCLTVTDTGSNFFDVDTSPETLKKTTLGLQVKAVAAILLTVYWSTKQMKLGCMWQNCAI